MRLTDQMESFMEAKKQEDDLGTIFFKKRHGRLGAYRKEDDILQ